MATVGQTLTAPETGWKRFDDNNSNISYTAGFASGSNPNCYARTFHQISNATKTESASFNFYGTQIRLISIVASWYTSNAYVELDGVVYSLPIVGSSTIYQALVFNKTGLDLKDHSVRIYMQFNGSANGLCLDAIDIDDNGALNSYSPISSISAPTNLTATAGDSLVNLSWTAVSGATGYNVKRSTTTGGPYTTIGNNVSSPNYIDKSVTNGTPYYYVVTALNGSTESANSNETSATPVISVPTNLTAVAGNAQVSLTWVAVAGVTGYSIKRSTTSGGAYATIANHITGNSYVDSTISNGITYYYVVTAISGDGESATSNEVSAKPVISAPTNLTATAGDSKVSLSWTAVANAAGYNVKRSTTVSSGPFIKIASNVSSTNYTDSTVTNGTTYYYVVAAVDSNKNESATNSNEVSTMPAETGKALLRVTMIEPNKKEYLISFNEIYHFINWLNYHKDTDTISYAFNKQQGSKEYLIFGKIASFEVNPLKV